jgi:type IV secretory pathway VirD2 relaxase
MHYHEVAAYVAYLAKHGKGEDGGPGEHFDRHGTDVDIPEFLARYWRSPWVFKVILSPSPDASVHLPLQEYAQSWMLQVEADLGCRVDWVAGCHYDTDSPHVQFLWNGRTKAGAIVNIDRSSISHGLRTRASEILSLYGGY